MDILTKLSFTLWLFSVIAAIAFHILGTGAWLHNRVQEWKIRKRSPIVPGLIAIGIVALHTTTVVVTVITALYKIWSTS